MVVEESLAIARFSFAPWYNGVDYFVALGVCEEGFGCF